MGVDAADARLMVGLLGPVELGPAGGVMPPVAQPRLRVLLGLLAVTAGRMVTAESLVDGVWGEEWSPRREQNLHALVYQLRRRLAALEPAGGPGRGGYRLALGPRELDVSVFHELVARGRESVRAGDTAVARELFGQALGVWWGAALPDAAPLCARLAGEAARLEELRLAVVEERIGCDLALGAHAEVAGEPVGLVAEFPLRERLAGLLMTALYRCGRHGKGAGGLRHCAAGPGRGAGPRPRAGASWAAGPGARRRPGPGRPSPARVSPGCCRCGAGGRRCAWSPRARPH
jgi:DNA-binding SARP family transcriptional activator